MTLDATNASYYHLDKAYVNIISLPLYGIGLYNHNIFVIFMILTRHTLLLLLSTFKT